MRQIKVETRNDGLWRVETSSDSGRLWQKLQNAPGSLSSEELTAIETGLATETLGYERMRQRQRENARD